MTPDEPERRDLLTAAETASLLRVSRSWVQRHRDELGGRVIGRVLRFHRQQVLAFGPPEPITPKRTPKPAVRPAATKRADDPLVAWLESGAPSSLPGWQGGVQ